MKTLLIVMSGILLWSCANPSTEASNTDTLEITPENMFDFPYPRIQLRERAGNNYVFLLAGPAGNWKIVGGDGIKSLSRNRGTFPFTLQVQRDSTAAEFSVQLEFIGSAFTKPDGTTNGKGDIYPFGYSG